MDVDVALACARNRQATGVDRYAREIAAALRAAGVTTREVALERREWKVGPLRVGGSLSLWAQRRKVRGAKGELVHALDPASVSRDADVVTIHDLLVEEHADELLPDARSRLDWRLTRALARRVPWIVTPSDATRQAVVRRWGVDPARVVACHHGIDHARFRPVGSPSALAEGKPTVAYVGDDNPRKNLRLLVAAVAELRERHGVDARLVRAGPTRFPRVAEAYRREAAKRGVDLVEPGYLDDDALVALLSRASVFAWPSLGEGFGFPPLEAMACGAPVVAHDNAVNREVCGALARYHPDDAAMCADALAATLRAPPAREAILAHARSFTWDASAKRHLAVYEKAREARA